jgi:hypothetical protein
MEFEQLPGTSAFEAAIRSIHESQRLVVVGSDEFKEMVTEHVELAGKGPQTTLKKVDRISGSDWLKKGIRKWVTDEAPLGKWPAKPPRIKEWALNRNILSGHVHDTVYVARVKISASWEIPAVFQFGGGNDVPQTEVHCAVWKYWEKEFGAHIVGISHDIIEAKVFAPPASKERALELAKEQYAYCSDIVNQGAETIARLGAMLLNSDQWYFWWD